MPCGQSWAAFKIVSKAAEFVLKEVFDATAEEAKMGGKALGVFVAAGVAIATLDGPGSAATAAEIGSGERSLDL